MIQYIVTLLRGKWSAARTIALPIWLGLILFSSTSLAGKAANAVFTRLVSAPVRRYDTYDLYHRYHVYFLAEKTVHITMFIVLGLLLWRLLPDGPGKIGLVLLCGSVIGCCSELAQCLFPGRDPAVRDVLINAAGTAIGMAIGFYRMKFPRRSQSVIGHRRVSVDRADFAGKHI